MTHLDPADYAVISQALQAIAREMGAKLVRSAYSTVVREARDASAALCDARGHTVAQAELIPMQLGSIGATIQPCLALYPAETLAEGDFLITNDPYQGGQHLQDVFIFTPIFVAGEVVAFSASIAHHLDLGGGNPGLNTSSRDVYQEGLIIPPSRYSEARDWNGGGLERLIARNVRVPAQTIGDFYAQFAANHIGAARVRQLCERYGVATVKATMAELQDYAERRVRAAIAAVPDGVYEGEDATDSEWGEGRELIVKARVTVKGDTMTVDFAGTSDQVSRHVNAPFASTVSATLSCIKAVLTGSDVPFNEGAKRPISVTAPYGSILNPRPPAPVRARMTTSYRAYGAVMRALAGAVPEKIVAQGFDTTWVAALSHLTPAGYRVHLDILGGGNGASFKADGCDGVDGPLSNCSNTPVEVLDMDFDFFRTITYELVPDGGGAGRQRGGAGFRRSFQALKDGVNFAMYADRLEKSPGGVAGGLPGARAVCVIQRGAKREGAGASTGTTLDKGDVVEMVSGGGAGFGRPKDRARAALADDLADGLVSPAAAARTYGLAEAAE
ncbi:MAG: hydantoinase B/oxoprolinase family protein [Alphaproteobacteria bacterium]|nr:hydantoinase B/oxoprolinase family protein [Alphaproteobacteria bacterium]